MPYKNEWKKKYSNLKNRAKERGIEFNLSFEEYIKMAENACISDPSQIGRNSGSYQVGRIGDVGPYSIDNCRFIPKEQNDKEALDNGRYEEMSKNRKGKTKYDDQGRMSASIKLSNSFELISPTGEKFEGINLKEFCKVNNLDQGHMSKVCTGKLKQHKGWTGKYKEKSK